MASSRNAREGHLQLVGSVYESVIADVIRSCREAFREEGLGDEVLEALKADWELRVRKSGCVPFYGLGENRTVVNVRIRRDGVPDAQTPDIKIVVPRVAAERHSGKLREQLVALANHVRKEGISDADAKWLIETKLEEVFGDAEKIAQLDGAELGEGSSDDDFDSDSSSGVDSPLAKRAKTNNLGKTNGKAESASEEASSSSSEEEKEEEEDDGGEPPLNSDDDLSDMDPELLFETDNLTICQYTDVTEGKGLSRHGWKMKFKRGIMNMNGVDYLFDEMEGEAVWL